MRAFRVTQQLQALAGRLLQHAAVDLVGLRAAGHVLAFLQVKAQDVAALLLVETGARLLAQVLQLQQLGQHGRRAEAVVKRVGLGRKVVLQRLDDVRHGVQAHHVGGAEGATGRAAQTLAGQVIDHVKGQAEFLDLLHRRQHAGDADAVGDEVGRVLGAHHALAERGGDEGFELIEHFGLRRRRGDQLHQHHVARRVEEVDAAKTRAQRLGQCLAQLGDRQARGVAGQDGVLGYKGRDLVIQVALPVHALGNGLNHQIAAFELLQVVVVVGGFDQRRVFGHAQWCGLELFQVLDGLQRDAVLGPFLGGQVEQDHGHLAVDEMGRNLRAHHARAEHGDFLDVESGHSVFLHWTRVQVCVRPNGPMEPRTSSFLPPSMGVRRSA